MEDVTPLSDVYILDIITAHLSTAGIHQTIMFLVALADMGETRRCRIKLNICIENIICIRMQHLLKAFLHSYITLPT